MGGKTNWACLLLAAALSSCAPVGTSDKEGLLASSGFQRHDADTPAKLAKLQSLPQYQLVYSQRKSGPVYVFADVQGCKCAWIGTPDQYKTYQLMRQGQQISDMQNSAVQIEQAQADDFGGVWGPEIPMW